MKASADHLTCPTMKPKPRSAQRQQTPEVNTAAQALDFFRSPLGVLAKGMEPSAAFNSLTPNARAFVLAVVESGGTNITRAARMAGYTGTDASLQAHSSRLCVDPKVQLALTEVAMGLAKSSSLLAVTQLLKMIEHSQSEKTKLTAITKLINLIGLEPEKTVNMKHTIEVEPTTKERVDEIVRMAKEVGIDPRKLLGKAGVIVDAEFAEVGTSAGLEDLLGDDDE